MGFRTLLDIRTEVRDEVGEPLAFEGSRSGYWTKEELNRRINRALAEVCRKTYCNEASIERPAEPNVQAYSVPAQVLPGGTAYFEYEQPAGAVYPLRYRDHKLLRSWGTDTFGIPRFWSVWRNCYYLWPIPSDEGESMGLNIQADASQVYIALPSGDRLLLYDMAPFTVDGVETLVLSIASGSVRLELPDGNTLVLGATTETGTPTVTLTNHRIKITLPSGDTVSLYDTVDEVAQARLNVRFYGMPEPLVDDTDGVELHDIYHDALVHRVAYWLLVGEDANRRQDHLFAWQQVTEEANLAYRTRQMQQPSDMHSESEYLGDLDGRGMFRE